METETRDGFLRPTDSPARIQSIDSWLWNWIAPPQFLHAYSSIITTSLVSRGKRVFLLIPQVVHAHARTDHEFPHFLHVFMGSILPGPAIFHAQRQFRSHRAHSPSHEETSCNSSTSDRPVAYCPGAKNMELPTTTAILRATLPARAPPNLYPYTSEFVGALRDPISSSSSSFFYLLCAILFVSRTFAITRWIEVTPRLQFAFPFHLWQFTNPSIFRYHTTPSRHHLNTI